MSAYTKVLTSLAVGAVVLVGAGNLPVSAETAAKCFGCMQGYDDFTEEWTHIDFIWFGNNDRKGSWHLSESPGDCNVHVPYLLT